MEEQKQSRNHSLEEIVAHIRKNDSFILLPHVFIDGDDLGSMIALSIGLTQLGKTCVTICHENIPAMFRFLPGVDGIHREIPPTLFDCAILIECTNLSRLPQGLDVKSFARTIVNVDHHPGNGYYGDLNYIDNKAAAVGEIVYEILQSLEIPIDKDIATAIYVSIITDTGGFQFANTTARTHRIVSELLKHDLNISEISRIIFHGQEFNVLKLRGDVISTLRNDCDGKLVWGTLTLDMMKKWNVLDEDTQQLIEDMNVIRDAEVVVLLKEARDRQVRVSMRSRRLPVNEVARKYNGGGHVLAAGCTINGSIAEVECEILKTLREFLASHAQCGAVNTPSSHHCPPSV